MFVAIVFKFCFCLDLRWTNTFLCSHFTNAWCKFALNKTERTESYSNEIELIEFGVCVCYFRCRAQNCKYFKIHERRNGGHFVFVWLLVEFLLRQCYWTHTHALEWEEWISERCEEANEQTEWHMKTNKKVSFCTNWLFVFRISKIRIGNKKSPSNINIDRDLLGPNEIENWAK